jgi:soluble lytic murein transglycosylase-like protein
MKISATTRIGSLAALLCGIALVILAPTATAGEIALLKNGFTIPHEHRALVGPNTRLYLDGGTASYIDIPTADIEGFQKDLTLPVPAPPKPHPPAQAPPAAAAAPAPDLNEVVSSASATFHLDPDLVNSVIHAESGFNTHAVSRKGAQGLMQLMPGTASKLGVNNTFDPRANVNGGSRYLRELLERYNFDLVKALAAYNAGPERVEQYNGVPPYRETRAYVNRIVREYNRKVIAQQRKTQPATRDKKTNQQPPSPKPQH